MPQPRRNMHVSRANNSNAFAVQRARAAQRTAQSIAAQRRNARDHALQDVHLEINELTALPPHDDEYVVERLVPARFQPLAQSVLPGILRRRGVLRPQNESQTVFDYAHGYPEFAIHRQRVRVGEQLRGWLLPGIIEQPDIYPNRHNATPSQHEPGALVVVSDHRSWAGGTRAHYPGPADVEPPNIIGVIDNDYALGEDHAIETISDVSPNATTEFVNSRVEILQGISAALAAIRHNAGP